MPTGFRSKPTTMNTENFISYAQNGEDIMLHRAFKDIQRGFYIDVGAQDPVVDSVTKAFYERGWRGINIEPVAHWYKRLVADRPHDINLQVAASDSAGSLRLFEVEGTGLSTCNAEFARRHREQGLLVTDHTVACVTLDGICSEHQIDLVHFLKMDCEGAELQALRGMSFTKIRPWVVLVEATEPNSTEPTWQEWEPILTGKEYVHVYSDGLNRFYIAREHVELQRSFETPPNALDGAVREIDVRREKHIARLTAELEQSRSAERAGRLQSERDELRMVLATRDAHITNVEGERDELRMVLATRDAHITNVESERDLLRTAIAEQDAQIEGIKAQHLLLRTQAGRREAELATLRASGEQLQGMLWASDQALQDTRRAREEERARAELKLAGANDLCRQWEAEVGSMHASRSWRITAPLRTAGNATRRLKRVILRAAFIVFRPLARLAKPVLRGAAKSRLARSAVTGSLGKHSRFTETARLFLFGAPSAETQVSPRNHGDLRADAGHTSGDQEKREGSPGMTDSLDALSERWRKAKQLLEEIRLGGSEGDKDAHRS